MLSIMIAVNNRSNFLTVESKCLLEWANCRVTILSQIISCDISNTRDSVPSGYPGRHWEERWNYDMQRSISGEIRGVWIANETLSQVFGKSSQSKQKPRSKRRLKSHKSTLIEMGYPNFLHDCEFLCFNLMNYPRVWKGKCKTEKHGIFFTEEAVLLPFDFLYTACFWDPWLLFKKMDKGTA